LHDLDRTVVVAVVAVRVMQMSVDEIVDVVTMRDGLMAAARTMDVVGLVRVAAVVRRALLGVLVGDLEAVLLDLAALLVVEVAIVQEIDVVVVLDRGMTAARAMVVRVVVVFVSHERLLVLESQSTPTIVTPLTHFRKWGVHSSINDKHAKDRVRTEPLAGSRGLASRARAARG
jgi:hypothetical protein